MSRPRAPRRSGSVMGRLLAAATLVLAVGVLTETGPSDEGPPAHEEVRRAPQPAGDSGRLPGDAAAEGHESPAALLLDTAEPGPPGAPPSETARSPGGRAAEEAPEVELVQETPEGFHVLGGDAAAGTGDRHTFTLEVAPPLRARADELERVALAALLDEERSWARDRELVQVTVPEEADVRVVLAEPSTVDEHCLAAGLDTAGVSSCWDGQRAMLNADRWREGVDHIDDLATYRTYLVNHEVGHALGRGHQDCPGAGEAAPVMMQQTMRLGACEPNPWPHP